jgi:hypothetical protein
MTELFFEGAEPSLSEVPLADLLAKFPVGSCGFVGTTVDEEDISANAVLSHAIPAGPVVSSMTGPGNLVVIGWGAVVGPPPGFPMLPIVITVYQAIVGSFQVTLPATTFSVTVPPEFVAALGAGTHRFEVLTIELGGNRTITEGTLTL